jgi:2-C-methyl-D-erythritol 2,4-cyclodiphosphate synthase
MRCRDEAPIQRCPNTSSPVFVAQANLISAHSPVVPRPGIGYFLPMTRTGIGFDAHRLVTGRSLVLGGVRIPHTQGLLGHSDADVLAHAVMDALLGAVADGDIGQHFPDRDPRWKDADSVGLLRLVTARIRELGWRVVSTDATVMAEAPRLAPFVTSMRERLAGAMGVTATDVSIKATTMEGMGAVGRGEGIACLAIATVARLEDEGQGT